MKEGGKGQQTLALARKMLDAIFIINITAAYIHLAWSLILIMLIFIMFNINSFYLSFPILKLHYWGFLYKNIFKKIQKIFHIVSYNSLVRNSKFLLVCWNRITSRFLKVLRKLIREACWFCFLSIYMDRIKENFAHRSFLLVTKLNQQLSSKYST